MVELFRGGELYLRRWGFRDYGLVLLPPRWGGWHGVDCPPGRGERGRLVRDSLGVLRACVAAGGWLPMVPVLLLLLLMRWV